MIHWTYIVFGIVVVILLNLTLRDNSRDASTYMGAGLSILENIFWGFILIFFIVLWGGIFWW